MEVRYTADQVRYQTMNTTEIRDSYLVENMFVADEIFLLYTDVDRGIVGSVVPAAGSLKLSGINISRSSWVLRFMLSGMSGWTFQSCSGQPSSSIDGSKPPTPVFKQK